MVTRLPVPIRFALPDGWHAAPPDEVGVPDAAFVALAAATRGSGFTANMTLRGEITGEVTDGVLTTMADESVRAFAASAPHAVRNVTVTARAPTGSRSHPSLVQTLRFVADVNGVTRALVQFQLYLAVARWTDPKRGVVLRASLTCTEEQVAEVLEGFHSFVDTLAPELPGPGRLPVPIRYELPDGWQLVPPDEFGAWGAAVAALHAATRGQEYTANITIDGQLRNNGLAGLADESVQRLVGFPRSTTATSRRETGAAEDPGLTRTTRSRVIIDGVPRELVTVEVYLPMGRSADQRRTAVVRAALSCTTEQVGLVLDDFRAFVATLAPDVRTRR